MSVIKNRKKDYNKFGIHGRDRKNQSHDQSNKNKILTTEDFLLIAKKSSSNTLNVISILLQKDIFALEMPLERLKYNLESDICSVVHAIYYNVNKMTDLIANKYQKKNIPKSDIREFCKNNEEVRKAISNSFQKITSELQIGEESFTVTQLRKEIGTVVIKELDNVINAKLNNPSATPMDIEESQNR